MTRPVDGLRKGPGLAAGLTRAGAVLVLGAVGVALLWPRLALAGMPAQYHGRPLPPGLSPTFNEPAGQVAAQHVGGSLPLLVAAAVLGVLAGLATAAVHTAATADGGADGGVVGGLGWLAGTLWTLPSPVVVVTLAFALTIAGHGNLAQLSGPVGAFALAGYHQYFGPTI